MDSFLIIASILTVFILAAWQIIALNDLLTFLNTINDISNETVTLVIKKVKRVLYFPYIESIRGLLRKFYQRACATEKIDNEVLNNLFSVLWNRNISGIKVKE